jgi:hypothetical protein
LLLKLRNAFELDVQIAAVFRELGLHFIDQRAQAQVRAPEPGDFGVRRAERCRQRNVVVYSTRNANGSADVFVDVHPRWRYKSGIH